MQDLVQLHTRVRSSTKEAIKKLAKQKRCELGAIIDEAIRLYEQHNKARRKEEP